TPAGAATARLNEITALEPTDGFSGAVINAAALPFTEAMNLCRQLRQRERGVGPIILLLDHYQLDDLTFREDLFDDFVVGPYDVSELATRLRQRERGAAHRTRRALDELRDVPGVYCRARDGPYVHGVRAPQVPRDESKSRLHAQHAPQSSVGLRVLRRRAHRRRARATSSREVGGRVRAPYSNGAVRGLQVRYVERVRRLVLGGVGPELNLGLGAQGQLRHRAGGARGQRVAKGLEPHFVTRREVAHVEHEQ